MDPGLGWGVRSQKQIHAAVHESCQKSCTIGRATQDVVGVTFLKEKSTSCFCLSRNIVLVRCAIFGWPGSLGKDILRPHNQGTSCDSHQHLK